MSNTTEGWWIRDNQINVTCNVLSKLIPSSSSLPSHSPFLQTHTVAHNLWTRKVTHSLIKLFFGCRGDCWNNFTQKHSQPEWAQSKHFWSLEKTLSKAYTTSWTQTHLFQRVWNAEKKGEGGNSKCSKEQRLITTARKCWTNTVRK